MEPQESVAPKPPERRFVFKLNLGADDRRAIIGALRHIEFLISSEQMTTGCSGGYDCGYDYELRENPEMTHDRFFNELQAYLDAKREETGE